MNSNTSSNENYYSITFIHPNAKVCFLLFYVKHNIIKLLFLKEKVSAEIELKDNNDINSDIDSDDTDNFEEIFIKYITKWKSYMADIPNAFIQCLYIFNESKLTKYWNILISIELSHHTEISNC